MVRSIAFRAEWVLLALAAMLVAGGFALAYVLYLALTTSPLATEAVAGVQWCRNCGI